MLKDGGAEGKLRELTSGNEGSFEADTAYSRYAEVYRHPFTSWGKE